MSKERKTVGEIIDEATEEGNLAKILKKRKTEAAQEYEEMKIRRLMAEEKDRINKLEGRGDPAAAQSFVGQILQMAEVDPGKAKAFLDGLDQENMNKIAYLMAAENDRAGAILKLAQSSGTSVKDLVEIVKMMRPDNGGIDIKGINDVFKTGIEAARAGGPPKSADEGFKYVYDTFVRPFQETLAQKDSAIMDARLKAMEEKIVNPLEWYEQQKAIAERMGYSVEGGGKSSQVDLKLEEMRQSHDLDMERLHWEQQKFMLQTEAERDKWGYIQQTFSPIFALAAPEIRNQLKNLGDEVGKTLTGKTQPNQPNQPPNQPQTAEFTCPNPECGTKQTIPVPPNAPDEVAIKCYKCGTVTQARLGPQGSQSPPGEAPPPRPRRLSPTYR